MYKKGFFIIICLIIYRLGVFVPIPLSALVEDFSLSFVSAPMNLINTFSGGALYKLGVFGLNVMPYITASIVLQLLSSTIPFLIELKNDGSNGRILIASYTKYLTFFLAIVQSYFFCYSISSNIDLTSHLVVVASVFSMTAGCLSLMWIGQFISSFGFSNGVSVLIFINILSSFPASFSSLFKMVFEGVYSYWMLTLIMGFFAAITLFVCFIEKAYRKIYIRSSNPAYSKIYSPSDSFLPLKINMTGVIPPIFANSAMMLPIMLLNYFGYTFAFVGASGFFYILSYSILIVFFSYFYTGVVVDTGDLSKNLKKSNHFIPGVRPGEATKSHVSKIINALTFFGSLYLVIVCVVPEFLINKYSIPFAFGGATILILVNVAMDIFLKIYLAYKDHHGMFTNSANSMSVRKNFYTK